MSSPIKRKISSTTEQPASKVRRTDSNVNVNVNVNDNDNDNDFNLDAPSPTREFYGMSPIATYSPRNPAYTPTSPPSYSPTGPAYFCTSPPPYSPTKPAYCYTSPVNEGPWVPLTNMMEYIEKDEGDSDGDGPVCKPTAIKFMHGIALQGMPAQPLKSTLKTSDVGAWDDMEMAKINDGPLDADMEALEAAEMLESISRARPDKVAMIFNGIRKIEINDATRIQAVWRGFKQRQVNQIETECGNPEWGMCWLCGKEGYRGWCEEEDENVCFIGCQFQDYMRKQFGAYYKNGVQTCENMRSHINRFNRCK